jgi:photosystem II stability/assembly factor-like uncharacterized protein
MIRYAAIFLLVATALSPEARAAGWEWQHPQPQGNHLQDICFLDTSTGFAVGDGETILGTQDGGAGWQLLHAGNTGIDFMQIQMLDAQNGWLLANQYFPAENNWILKTTDGWNNWVPVMESQHMIHDMHWIDENTGWLGTDIGLHSTSDGGQNWTLVLFGHRFDSVYFLDHNNGWCSHRGTVYHTSDGGVNWEHVVADAYAEKIIDIQFMTAADGWLIEYEIGPNYEAGRLYASHDSGTTWVEQLIIGGDWWYVHFQDIEMVDTLSGFICATDGELLRTTDGGGLWTPVDTLINPLAIEFADTCTGWAAGYYGMISRSINCGFDWQRQDLSTRINVTEWSDFQAFDPQNAIAGGRKNFLKTTDGGASWQHIPLDPLPLEYGNIISFFFIDEGHGWLSFGNASGGVMVVTDDGGLSFTPQPDVNRRCDEIFFINHNVGWAVAGNYFYSTTDGGLHWSEDAFPINSYYYSVCFIDSLEGWVGGNDLIHTIDGGQTWSSPALEDSGQIREVRFFDSQLGFAMTYHFPGGRIYRTMDGGEHWQRVLDVQGDALLTDLVLLEGRFVYTTGMSWAYPHSDHSLFYMSTDKGDSWERMLDIPLADGIYKLAAVDPWRMWVLGPGGAIAFGPLGTGTSIDVTQSHPSQDQLLQNYPNPFNPHTTISYRLSSPGDVSLTIYNVLGERIRSFSFADQSAGQHRMTWDGRNDAGRPVASGLYFCRMDAGGAAYTRKMVLLR